MLRVHLTQNWFVPSDRAADRALWLIASPRAFARLSLDAQIPDGTTTLNIRHPFDANGVAQDMLSAVNEHLVRKGLLLKRGGIADATIITAPNSTKNLEVELDPEMHQKEEGSRWHFDTRVHIAVDAGSGLVHTVTTMAANESDVEHIADLLHGEEQHMWAKSGYRGAQARADRDDL